LRVFLAFLGVKRLFPRKNMAREAVFGGVFKGLIIMFPVVIIILNRQGRKCFFNRFCRDSLKDITF
jgi:hypothetical protein